MDNDFVSLVQNSPKFSRLKSLLYVSTKLSLTGITNLVVNYEDTDLVNTFLNYCFKKGELYRTSINIDAVELQQLSPGSGYAVQYIDSLIYGSFKMKKPKKKKDKDGVVAFPGLEDNTPIPVIDPLTGARERNPNGFINRPEVIDQSFKDKLLILRNIDQSLDFCPLEMGEVDPRSLWIFDKLRDPNLRKGCRFLLVSNKRLKFPFKVRTVELSPVDELDATHLIDGFVDLYRGRNYNLDFTDSQKKQVIRKITGLTYTEAGDVLAEAISSSTDEKDKKQIDTLLALKRLRANINRNLMENSSGLTHLVSKPWEDYICPESSNFTYDVAKILRDFQEIESLNQEAKIAVSQGRDEISLQRNALAIQSRMPHVIVLYGKGGVGKSAFPLHFAGLLDFDVWDFNIGACHSKYVGEGAERMREALKQIAQASHVVVRIDEYDRAIGSGDSAGSRMHSAHKQVESEFMNWLQNNQEDNIFVKNNIFLVLTTNHKKNITGPLLRSGRADLVIDIDDFDSKSMKDTFLSAPRRMKHRGVEVAGFKDDKDFLAAIKTLDVGKLSEITAKKKFTVRDVDTLLIEMAAHQYYLNKGKVGIEWSTDSFVKVLNDSSGSAGTVDSAEFVLGDRALFESSE